MGRMKDLLEELKDQIEPLEESTTSAKKNDSQKPDLSMLPFESIIEVCRVMDYGAIKYDKHNWRKGMNWTRLSSAVLRHLFAWISGEDKDPETGITHLAHAACGLLFLISYEKGQVGNDDRYKDEN
jgi:hypothetical protein